MATVKKEKTASSMGSESLDVRLQEIPHSGRPDAIEIENNRVVQLHNQEDPAKTHFTLEVNEYSSLAKNMNRFKVDGIDSVYYIRNFITKIDEQLITDRIYEMPHNSWTYLPHSARRLQKWGGNVTSKGLEDQTDLPTFLESLAEKLYVNEWCPKRPNHVLLNEYNKGVGIMPHTDGPLYYPWVNSISLGSTCIFKFYKDMSNYKAGQDEGRLLLERGSLVIFTSFAYTDFMHTIDDISQDSILLLLDEEKSINQGKLHVISTNILNFNLTSLKQDIQNINLNEALEQGVILKLSSNPQFNYCLEIPREKRISLTIRNVPLPETLN